MKSTCHTSAIFFAHRQVLSESPAFRSRIPRLRGARRKIAWEDSCGPTLMTAAVWVHIN